MVPLNPFGDRRTCREKAGAGRPITGTDMAYTRPDGVKVVPIGCLRD